MLEHRAKHKPAQMLARAFVAYHVMPALSDCQQPFLAAFWLEDLEGIWTPAMPPCRCSNGRGLLQGLERSIWGGFAGFSGLHVDTQGFEASNGYQRKPKTPVISVGLMIRDSGSTCLGTGQFLHDLRHGPREEPLKKWEEYRLVTESYSTRRRLRQRRWAKPMGSSSQNSAFNFSGAVSLHRSAECALRPPARSHCARPPFRAEGRKPGAAEPQKSEAPHFHETSPHLLQRALAKEGGLWEVKKRRTQSR